MRVCARQRTRAQAQVQIAVVMFRRFNENSLEFCVVWKNQNNRSKRREWRISTKKWIYSEHIYARTNTHTWTQNRRTKSERNDRILWWTVSFFIRCSIHCLMQTMINIFVWWSGFVVKTESRSKWMSKIGDSVWRCWRNIHKNSSDNNNISKNSGIGGAATVTAIYIVLRS